jgi:putative transposase
VVAAGVAGAFGRVGRGGLAQPAPRRAAGSGGARAGVHAQREVCGAGRGGRLCAGALSAEDYIELLPARWQAINAYGVKVNHRTYDSADLNPFRRQRSGVKAKKDRWEVHHDPYDASRIWVRNHWDDGWIMCVWKHLGRVPVPFGELAWNHARQELGVQGEQATETAIAEAVAQLLERASHGPASAGAAKSKGSKRSRQVAARTRATTTPTGSQPDSAAPLAAEPAPDNDNDAHDGAIAEVVPLPVFDAREEAAKWW